eukprot:COSAG06_NODE_6103_length_3108_cov_1.433699_5_plen_54_part_00
MALSGTEALTLTVSEALSAAGELCEMHVLVVLWAKASYQRYRGAILPLVPAAS